MKKYVHYVTSFLTIVSLCAASLTLHAQRGVFNPSDTVATYDSTHPPVKPPKGQVAKWVRTPRVTFNTSGFKCYYYNGIAFRLKYPKNYDSTKPYPILIFLHGEGEAGKTIYDNEYQLYHGGTVHENAVNSGKFDGFLLYPQNTTGFWNTGELATINSLIESVMIPLKIVDPFRVYIDGLSAGGTAAWNFLFKYTTLVAGLTPISSASAYMFDSVQKYKYTPIYHFQGGLDNNPSPAASHSLGKRILSVGSNYMYKEFPNRGHDCWYQAWGDPDYFLFYSRAYKSNPWPLYGRTDFCAGAPFTDTLGVTPGFDGYEWRKDSVLIPGANSNQLVVTGFGKYDCRIKKDTTWSAWSPRPVVIRVKAPTVQPMIVVADTGSNVIPRPDGSNSVLLQVPDSFATYTWQKVGNPTVLSTKRSLAVSSPGIYKVKVTEQYGCPADTLSSTTTARIQAEDFSAMSGVQTESTLDIGGGKNVGYIDRNDWMDYRVNVPTAKSYNVKLRLSSPNSRGQLSLLNSNGTVLAAVPVPNTSSYDVYQDVNTTINLVAGLQTIRIQSTASPKWNINWFDLTDPSRPDTNNFSMPFSVVSANGAGAPDSVTNLTAMALSRTAIQLSWNQTANPTFNETGFEIYMATTASGPYKYQVTTAADSTHYIFNGLSDATTYYYKVRAVNNNGASATVGPVSATTLRDNVPPTTPLNLRLGTITRYAVALQWDPATDDIGVAEYDIYVNGVKSYVVSGTVKAASVYNLVPNTTYTFAIEARDAADNTSSLSNSVTARTNAGTIPQDPSMFPSNPNNYSVYINMNIDNPAPAPWVNTNALPSQGLAFKNLRNYAGFSTSTTLTIVDNFSGYNPDGMNTGNNSGVYPDNVMRSSYYCDKGVVAKLQVSGLSLNHKYSFIFFDSRNGGGNRTSVYTIGSQKASLNASYNTSTTVQLDNIMPDENGTVTIQVALDSAADFAYLNALVIKAYYNSGSAMGANMLASAVAPIPETGSLGAASVFPNPAQNDVTLAVPLTQNVAQLFVQLTDASGSVVGSQTFRNLSQGLWTQRLSLSDKAAQPGVYFIRITGLPDGKSQVLKLMKVR